MNLGPKNSKNELKMSATIHSKYKYNFYDKFINYFI